MSESVTGGVAPVEIEVELQRSYLDYAMSVIVGRALPDVRGKPRHVVVTLRPRQRTGFWLHTLPEPPRVVLDIRR